MQELKQRIRHVPDFPKPGILFYDVTTLLKDPVGFRLAVDAMAEPYTDERIDRMGPSVIAATASLCELIDRARAARPAK